MFSDPHPETINVHPELLAYLQKHHIRTTVLDKKLFIVARDALKALGYADTSVLPLVHKFCPDRQIIELPTSHGIVRVNIIPVHEFMVIAMRCNLTPSAEIHALIINHASRTASPVSALPEQDVGFHPLP